MEANTSYTDAGYDMYNDIKHRTNGEIYLGVVGPVRTGKSTFIRRFMELCVLPVMQDENEKKRATDELPGIWWNHYYDDRTKVYTKRGCTYNTI